MPASRAAAPAAVAAGRAPCGSGVGVVPAGSTVAKAAADAVRVGSTSSAGLPARTPDGVNGFSVGPPSPVIDETNASWSPAECWRTWATFHSEQGVGRPRSAAASAAVASRSAAWARSRIVHVVVAVIVFVAEPNAPIGAVARAAGVGISALYRRYPSKEALLATLCLDGLRQFVAIAQAAREVTDPWEGFVEFLRGIVDADVHSLTVCLAGRFTPTPEHRALAMQAGALAVEILHRAQQAGAVRADIESTDLPMIYEQLAAIRLGDAEHIRDLRRRYLDVHLAGLRAVAISYGELTGSAPTQAELGARWNRTT
jgi:AcrR family transcriptional regulator